MKKNKKSQARDISPAEAVRFLEDLRLMSQDLDEERVAISLRVPGNILRAIKAKAKSDGKKYQSLMVEYLRQGLRQNR